MKDLRVPRPGVIILVFLALASLNGLVFFLGRAQGHSQHQISETRRVQARILVLVRQNTETRVALCTFQGQLRDNVSTQAREVGQSQAFLRSHPDGLPALGFSRAQLEQSVAIRIAQLARTKAAFRSLSGLECASASR